MVVDIQEELNNKIDKLKKDISKLNEEKNTLIIKNRDVDKYIRGEINKYRKELISKIKLLKGSLSKAKVVTLVEED